MDHKTLAVDTTITDQDQGHFEAIVSGWDADREGDTIASSAFDGTIKAWTDSGKRIPLLFNHTTEAIGYIEPSSMRPTADGLVASGQCESR